jgi:hypothetical protein
MQEEPTEQWELGSGTWLRDRASENWRLVATRAGTAVATDVPAPDVAWLIQARRNPGGGWFPPEFKYSLQTGAPLGDPASTPDASWVPPFGESEVTRAQHPRRGLKRTPVGLALANAEGRSGSSPPDRTLPPLPRGPYRFVSHKFDASGPVLLAIEPDAGELLVLLPESQRWVPLAKAGGPVWAHRLRNARGWRMEVIHADGQATLYCPCDTGLAVITPSVFGLNYSIECAGHGPALGGPVAWGGEIWTPVHAKGDTVHLVGKPQGAAGRVYVVLPTQAAVPAQGFEAPVFDEKHVIWPSEQGHLVLRRDAKTGMHAEWLAWPEQVKPVFAIGSAYLEDDGTFWQLCRGNRNDELAYVQMARRDGSPHAVPVDASGVCSGRVCYRGTVRSDEAPWSAMEDAASTEVVVPLLESADGGAVIGLRMDAPRGVPAMLQGGHEPKRAILQVEVPGRPAVSFGGIAVKRPWMALPFVHDGHLWLHHPELVQVPGWKLEQ